MIIKRRVNMHTVVDSSEGIVQMQISRTDVGANDLNDASKVRTSSPL